MPSSRSWLPKRIPGLRALSAALLLVSCGSDTRSAPAAPDDPTLDFDAALDPVEVADGGVVRPVDPGLAPVAGRPDAGKLDAGQAGAADAADGSAVGDARAQELGAFAAIERLLVADGKVARVYAFDAPSRQQLNTFDLNGAGPLYAGASGRYGYVLESAQNLVQIISTGLPELSAGAPTLSEPSLLRSSFAGLSPAAFSAHERRAVILFAGGPELALLDEEDLETGHPSRTLTLSPGESSVLHLGDRILVSRNAGASGSGLRLLDDELSPVAGPDLPCDLPEGATRAGDVVAVACATDVLLWNTKETTTKRVSYPSSAASERAHKLAPSPTTSAFLTLLGARLCLLQEEDFTCVDVPGAGVIDYTFDPSGKRALALARDGTLYAFDAETLQTRDPLALLQPVAEATPARELPGLAIGRRYVYVSDPERATVYIVDASTAKIVDELAVRGGFPTQIAVFKYGI